MEDKWEAVVDVVDSNLTRFYKKGKLVAYREVHLNGDERKFMWFDDRHRLHRRGDLPAYTYIVGHETELRWCRHGKLYRKGEKPVIQKFLKDGLTPSRIKEYYNVDGQVVKASEFTIMKLENTVEELTAKVAALSAENAEMRLLPDAPDYLAAKQHYESLGKK